MAFLKKARPLPKLSLCGNPLPWTDKCKHLGVTIANRIDGCEQDMKVKNAMYIDKNIELNQEFYFAHPDTKLTINKIYNMHFSGSPLWNLFGSGALSIESTYNRSMKIMMDLPYGTHRALIEPLTGEKHLKKILLSRFLGFMEKIKKSGKKGVRMLMETAMKDVRSVTGSNYRNIMLLLGKTSVDDVFKEDVENIEYFKLADNEAWKVETIKEIIQVKQGLYQVPGFANDELETILDYLCTG